MSKVSHKLVNIGGITLDTNNILIISACIVAIMLVGMIVRVKIWKIIKLIFNSILGGVLIFLINQIGTTFGLHIGLNVITSIFIGIFGIPGALLLVAMKVF